MSEVVEIRTPGPVGPEGPTGPEGPSAYEVAVTNGFVGTESEWVASLEGPQGPIGPAGEVPAGVLSGGQDYVEGTTYPAGTVAKDAGVVYVASAEATKPPGEPLYADVANFTHNFDAVPTDGVDGWDVVGLDGYFTAGPDDGVTPAGNPGSITHRLRLSQSSGTSQGSRWVEKAVTVAVDTVVVFWDGVSTKAGVQNAGRFYIDGVIVHSIDGEQPWTKRAFAITAGTHTLRWRYWKQGTAAVGTDSYYVANLALHDYVAPSPWEELVAASIFVEGDEIYARDTSKAFVVGSDASGSTGSDSRMFFLPAKAAFRAGSATGTTWDAGSVGSYSHAVGSNTQASGTATAAEGYATTASGSLGAHSEGYGTQATGAYGSHAEGQSTVASGWAAHAEGSGAKAEGNYSHASGKQSAASAASQRAHSGGQFAAAGDAQISEYVLRAQTTDATAKALTVDAAAVTATATNPTVVRLPAETLLTFRIVVSARRTDVEGEMAGFVLEGVAGRDATGNGRIIGTPLVTAWGDTGTELWGVDLAIDTTSATNNYLAINVTGEAAKTIRWVAGIYTTEVRS